MLHSKGLDTYVENKNPQTQTQQLKTKSMRTVIQEFEKDTKPQVWEHKQTPSYEELWRHLSGGQIISWFSPAEFFFEPSSETAGNIGLDTSGP